MADSLLALAELLAPARREDEDEEPAGAPLPPPASRAIGPGAIGPRSSRGAEGGSGAGRTDSAGVAASPSSLPAAARETPGSSGRIWSAEEVPEGGGGEEAAGDAREQPEYEILFKQHVGAEDIFLGMSRKDPSTACCEEMLIKIQLPDTRASDITLDIREKVLDLRSPQKKLLLHLPHPVDAASGKARFLSDKGALEVALRMQRDLDFINFA